jgi:uncharacterized damage-inducible protein DinB
MTKTAEKTTSMTKIDMIRFALSLSGDWTSMAANDLADAPMTFPTPAGGNHPTWVVGHLAIAEAGLLSMITGCESPLKAWEPLFSAGTTPSADGSKYPPYHELLAAYQQARAQTLAHLDKLTDADLDRRPPAVPAELAENDMFSSVGRVLMFTAAHQMSHFGQLTDSRRALGRAPLMM